MSEQARPGPDLLGLYDEALPAVYGYLLSRCGSTALAEDLTAETFLAAVTAVRKGIPALGVPWLIGTARHKLVDHWRAMAREQFGTGPGVRGATARPDPARSRRNRPP